MIRKNSKTAGADERTPSRSQYFSWINNTNEGSTEAQTLINLAYFKFLRDRYNMKLDIYAWDAGNLDGARETYETFEGAKLKAQYPGGYAPLAQAAAEIGTRLGVWCGPDGFGNTPEEAAARHELMVSLCRDYHFALFKIDGVCGQLRVKKRGNFVKMMKECRAYSPDLILLNHRLPLGKGEPYATTFLWEGVETYIDVHVCNPCTAMHNRAYLFHRGNVPGLQRLTEDHGVCISSCNDYFEDDLIFQAFGRCLILAPEIYGNPWLLRDDEQARLARIYNLHRKHRSILVDGMLLPASYGRNAVARGDAKTRFLTLGNCSWEPVKITITLGEEIGLSPCDCVTVASHHPYERLHGIYKYGEKMQIEVMPFRAALVEVSAMDRAPHMLEGCDYEVLHEDENGNIDKVKIVQPNGAPIHLGRTSPAALPKNAQAIVEATLFAADNDSLEYRSLLRAGETQIPEVQAARDAFFSQRTYKLRGCDGRFAFDGDPDTFFDGWSKTAYGGLRESGGCLRADFGDVYQADTVIIEFFDPDEPIFELGKQQVPEKGSYCVDLNDWQASNPVEVEITAANASLEAVKEKVHNIVTVKGQRKRAVYSIRGDIRYFRLPRPMDRIFKIALRKDGEEIALQSPRVNNLFFDYSLKPAVAAQKATINIPAAHWRPGSYLAIGLNGKHGTEGAFATVEIDGKLVGAPSRAPSYQSNVWECLVRRADQFYTYFIPVTEDMPGQELVVHVMHLDSKNADVTADIYLCEPNDEKQGEIVALA